MPLSRVQRCRKTSMPRPPPSSISTSVRSSTTILGRFREVTASFRKGSASPRTILPAHCKKATSPVCSRLICKDMCPSVWLGEQLWGDSASGSFILDEAPCGRFAIWEPLLKFLLYIAFEASPAIISAHRLLESSHLDGSEPH